MLTHDKGWNRFGKHRQTRVRPCDWEIRYLVPAAEFTPCLNFILSIDDDSLEPRARSNMGMVEND